MWRLRPLKSNQTILLKASPCAGLFFAQFLIFVFIMLIKKRTQKNKPEPYKRIGATRKISIKVLKSKIMLAG